MEDVRIEQSAEIGELITAIIAATPSFGQVGRGNVAEVKDRNGNLLYEYTYPDLGSTLAATKKPLMEQGVLITQGYQWTQLTHTSGQWQRSTMSMSCNGGPQDFGIAMTYGRRYTLLGILALAPKEGDTDGPPQEPLCVGKAEPIATANIERCDALAEIDSATREQVWGWACQACEIPKDGDSYPGPKQLYVSEGKAVAELLKTTLARKQPDPAPADGPSPGPT